MVHLYVVLLSKNVTSSIEQIPERIKICQYLVLSDGIRLTSSPLNTKEAVLNCTKENSEVEETFRWLKLPQQAFLIIHNVLLQTVLKDIFQYVPRE